MSCGHKISTAEAEAIWRAAEEAERDRAAKMPTERDALLVMFGAFQRLRELGWRDAMYAPRDGRLLEFIEAGSTGIHKGHKDEKFVWIHDAGDLWPSSPILFREVVEVVSGLGSEVTPRNAIEQNKNKAEGK